MSRMIQNRNGSRIKLGISPPVSGRDTDSKKNEFNIRLCRSNAITGGNDALTGGNDALTGDLKIVTEHSSRPSKQNQQREFQRLPEWHLPHLNR